MPTPSVEVTVLLPCLNEAETLAVCVQKAVRCLAELGVDGEVLVSDNGSTDGSQQIAVDNGARVVVAPIRGYGGALQAGIEAARGRYVIMADSDDSYDLSNLGPFIERLREGNDVVMGNRFKGGIAPGAMPFLHRYLGNPVLSLIGRVLFGLKHVGDFHCGIRGFNRARIQALGLCMPGMEFASELVVRAALAGYTLVEVPTTLRPDGRSRPPHLRTWRDGWRHLRFLLVFAPSKILVWPGAVLGGLGLVATAALAWRPIPIGGATLDVNALIYACLLVIVGVQLVLFGGFAQIYGRHEGITHVDHLARWTKLLRLETCMAIGLLLMVLGGIGTVVAVSQWGETGFGPIENSSTIRWVLVSTTSISVGFIIICAGLFSSLLTLRSARPGRLVFDDENDEVLAAR
ncbi:glycosyltransferase family 2 protein [Virgisporangium ochraceum]